MKKYIALSILVIALTHIDVSAQRATSHDSTYYDFWVGDWYQVVDGEVKEEPRFRVKRGIYHSSFEEQWQLEGYKAKAWRGWDASSNT